MYVGPEGQSWQRWPTLRRAAAPGSGGRRASTPGPSATRAQGLRNPGQPAQKWVSPGSRVAKRSARAKRLEVSEGGEDHSRPCYEPKKVRDGEPNLEF